LANKQIVLHCRSQYLVSIHAEIKRKLLLHFHSNLIEKVFSCSHPTKTWGKKDLFLKQNKCCDAKPPHGRGWRHVYNNDCFSGWTDVGFLKECEVCNFT